MLITLGLELEKVTVGVGGGIHLIKIKHVCDTEEMSLSRNCGPAGQLKITLAALWVKLWPTKLAIRVRFKSR